MTRSSVGYDRVDPDCRAMEEVVMSSGARPGGVTVLAVLVGLAAIPPLAYGIISLIGSAATFLSTADSPALPILAIGVVYLAVAVVYLAVAWALLSLRPWAWILAAIVAVGHIAINVVSALTGNVGWPQAIGASIIPIIVAVYLFRGDVRAAFGR
jgi:hypothetical protein